MSLYVNLPKTEKGTWPEVAESEIVVVAKKFVKLVDDVFEYNQPSLNEDAGAYESIIEIDSDVEPAEVVVSRVEPSIMDFSYEPVHAADRTLESIVINQCDDSGNVLNRVSYNLKGNGIVRRWVESDMQADAVLDFAMSDIHFDTLIERMHYIQEIYDAIGKADEMLGYQNQPATYEEIIRLRELLLGAE